LLAKVNRLAKDPGPVHPLAYWAGDGGARRRLYVEQAKLNQRRKFAKWYPAVTDTGFSHS